MADWDDDEQLRLEEALAQTADITSSKDKWKAVAQIVKTRGAKSCAERFKWCREQALRADAAPESAESEDESVAQAAAAAKEAAEKKAAAEQAAAKKAAAEKAAAEMAAAEKAAKEKAAADKAAKDKAAAAKAAAKKAAEEKAVLQKASAEKAAAAAKVKAKESVRGGQSNAAREAGEMPKPKPEWEILGEDWWIWAILSGVEKDTPEVTCLCTGIRDTMADVFDDSEPEDVPESHVETQFTAGRALWRRDISRDSIQEDEREEEAEAGSGADQGRARAEAEYEPDAKASAPVPQKKPGKPAQKAPSVAVLSTPEDVAAQQRREIEANRERLRRRQEEEANKEAKKAQAVKDQVAEAERQKKAQAKRAAAKHAAGKVADQEQHLPGKSGGETDGYTKGKGHAKGKTGETEGYGKGKGGDRDGKYGDWYGRDGSGKGKSVGKGEDKNKGGGSITVYATPPAPKAKPSQAKGKPVPPSFSADDFAPLPSSSKPRAAPPAVPQGIPAAGWGRQVTPPKASAVKAPVQPSDGWDAVPQRQTSAKVEPVREVPDSWDSD